MRHLQFYIHVLLLSLISSLATIDANAQTDYNLPSNFYEAVCIFKSESFEMSIAERSKSKQIDVSTYYSAVIGDLNGDKFSEIVIPGGTHNKSDFFYIFNHEAILTKQVFLPKGYGMHTDYDSIILSDLDNDGKGEIIVTASNGQKLFIFDHEGELLAEESFPSKFPKTVGVADFDNDGIPEIYVGNRIYRYKNGNIILLAKANDADDNTLEATNAQDIDKDGIPELISANRVYKVKLTNPDGIAGNTVTKTVTCGAINNVSSSNTYMSRTFALADIDIDGQIDVVTLVPIFKTAGSYIEVTVWNPTTALVKYSMTIKNGIGGSFMRNSWPFIGDTDNNGFPDIVFMGGINKQYCTLVYRLEYDKTANDIVIRSTNDRFNDFSSMSTSMSMFDFNNDGKQEIIYRDESSLYILNGEDLTIQKEIDKSTSGTGWEYPVVASLTPSGESSIIICSGTSERATNGTLRIYGADTKKGKKPWMPARKVWNQYSFYQNTLCDDLKIIPNPAALNTILTSKDGKGKTMQPFNGHMLQLGIIKPSSLESVNPLADVGIEFADITYGYNRVEDKLEINFNTSNTGDAPMDPKIAIEVFKVAGDTKELIHTGYIDEAFFPGDKHPIDITISNFKRHYPFDKLEVHVARDKFDCDRSNNSFTVSPQNLSGVLYVKKGETGTGTTWADAMGELSDALLKTKEYNTLYPFSLTQIWVAEGTYWGNFEMQEGVNICGGFKGGEIEIEESRPLENKTILDAKNSGRPLTQNSTFRVPTLWRGLVLQNGETNEYGGGALLKEGSTLAYSLIRNNKSTANQGGGIHADNSKIINCVIEENKLINTFAEGAGIYMTNGSISRNNTIVKNSIETTSAAQGAGLFSNKSTACNNIIYANNINLNGSFEPNNIHYTGGLVHYNIAENDDSTDPKFLNFRQADYRLLPTSPALNIGNNPCISGWEYDIAGNDRIYRNKIADLGAFEYQAAKLVLNKEGYFYVNNQKEGNGSNWQNAVKELSDALTGAKFLNENSPNTIKKIWVAEGTYSGNFEFVEGANVHGGFAGHETDFNQMDTVNHKTLIDAQKQGRALTQTTDFNIPTEWAGVILENGLITETDKDVYGGGAYLRKNGILKYSTIKNSIAIATSINNRVNAYGGGIYLEEGANLRSSIIDNNIAEVNNQNPENINSGVALGGGINNNKNELSYLIIRNNKTISTGETNGAAIYSSADIINSIINDNKGQSAVFITEEAKAVNNTIVSNYSEHTVAGASTAKLQNSIVYNNTATIADISEVQYSTYYNLVNTDPKFESNSYKLTENSPARTYAKAELFPIHLDKDIANNQRIIKLKDEVKIIDAGAYQTTIKVASATAIKIEVPFDTDFSTINFLEMVAGLLEFDYDFESKITWNEGTYNQLLAGDYTLFGNLSNLPSGVFNIDNVLGTIIVTVKKNHIAEIDALTIDNDNWLTNIGDSYAIDCDYTSNTLPIAISLPYFATVKLDPNIPYTQKGNDLIIDLDVSKPGNHTLQASITSQDGKNIKEYKIVIVKYIPFWDIIEQKWNNTFVINNNKENNGGYEFVSYKWYKNDIEIGTKQYYSAGDNKTDLLDEYSQYRAEMIDVNGVQYSTCRDHPVLMNSIIRVSPNPVRKGEPIHVEVPLAEGQTGKVNIYSLSGIQIGTTILNTRYTTIEAPISTGMYILKISINGGVSESVRVIVY